MNWRRGWDSHHPTLLKTKDLADFRFLQIREKRSKALVDTRIAHAGAYTVVYGKTDEARPSPAPPRSS